MMQALKKFRAWLASWGHLRAPKQIEIQERAGVDSQQELVQNAVIETDENAVIEKSDITEPRRTLTMNLQVTKCEATPTSITVFFSEPVNQDPAPAANSALNQGNYTVYDPAPGSAFASPKQLSDPSVKSLVKDIQGFGNSGLIIPFATNVFNRGDWVLITANNNIRSVNKDLLDPSHATAAGQINGKNALRIENCIATQSNLQLFFSDNLDTSQLNTGSGSDPNLASNYPVTQLPGGASITPKTATYDPFNRATFLELAAAQQLEPGQWILIKVNNVASEAGPIANGGKNTFSTRVEGTGEPSRRLRKEAKEVTESVEDVVAYPLLTEQVSFPTVTGGGPVGGGAVSVPSRAGMSLGQVATSAITDVLGWKSNSTDPKGFIGALTQAFTLQDIEGHVEATWVPRSYAVQTDIGGGITGAQASLYTRAKDALDKALPLLDGLYPLDPDADPEYVKALREMARSQMTEIVKELGTVGGPSILRVNTYFKILLGQQHISFNPPTQPEFDPDKVKGTLGELRDTYGIYFLNNPFSNSIEDEQDITNFRVISDYMTSLLQSWISNGKFFDLSSTDSNFFGTQPVLLSRQFSVIGETVNEVRFTLDSVFIGPSERQTLLLQFAPQTNLPAMFLEDILREIEDFASGEGPRLLQDGGRISVKMLAPAKNGAISAAVSRSQ